MHAHNRAGRFARLGLESLENRTLLSATLPTQAPTFGPALAQAAAIASTASYSYQFSIGPSAVLIGTNSTTGNHRSTGMVMVALYRPGEITGKLGGAANAIPVALVTSSSSATPQHPDIFNTTFSVTLKIRDAATGVTGTVKFTGTLKGTMAWNQSALTMSFQGPLTRQITLGRHVYTITLKTSSLHVPAPGTSAGALIGATIAVR
jgi:hypothetical protein